MCVTSQQEAKNKIFTFFTRKTQPTQLEGENEITTPSEST